MQAELVETRERTCRATQPDPSHHHAHYFNVTTEVETGIRSRVKNENFALPTESWP